MKDCIQYFKTLDPEALKKKTIQTSLYLGLYCYFEFVLIDQLDSFFKKTEYIYKNLNEKIPDFERKKVIKKEFLEELKGYKEEARRFGMHSLLGQYAIFWKNYDDGLSDDDILRIAELQKLRNKIGHIMHKCLIDEQNTITLKDMTDLLYLTKKIDQLFVVHFDLPCNPDYDNIDVKKEDIIGGSIIFEYYTEMMKEYFE